MTALLEGICPIIATPFTDAGEVDYDGLAEVVRWMGAGGCHAATLFGIAGEYYKLSDEERRRMVDVTVDACQRAGLPSIISVTDHATEIAVQRARQWEEAGADCIMLLPPFFLKPSAGDLHQHMLAVARSVRVPVMIQYAPEQTGVTMTPEALAALRGEVETPVIYKIENRPPGRTISRLLEITHGEARIFIGNAGFQLLEGLQRGALGVMPGCSMFDVYLRIYDLWKRGDRCEAIRTHTALLAVLNHIRQNVEQIIQFEKRILKRRGVIGSDYCRRPGFASDAVYEQLFEEVYPLIESYLTA